jgi:ferredoxin
MNVCVDQSKCRTAGVCVKICPEIFTFEPGNKKAIAKTTQVPENLEKKCREAADKCPARAICLMK